MSRFLPQAIETVKEAIAFDDAKEFEKAFFKYKDALNRFVTVSFCVCVCARVSICSFIY